MSLRSALSPLFSVAAAVIGSAAQAQSFERIPEGVIVRFTDHALAVRVCAPNIFRVTASPDEAFFNHASLMIAAEQNRVVPGFEFVEEPHALLIKTAQAQARVDRKTGAVTFLDAAGGVVLAERAGGRSMSRAEVVGEKVLQVRQQWEPAADESLYGLGQNQSGELDLKDRDLDLWQRNTEVAVPVLVSSRGYGILWDNNGFTRFGDLREKVVPPAAQLIGTDGKPGGLIGTYFGDARFQKIVATQVDAKIAFEGPPNAQDANDSVHAALPKGDVAVRWEGSVEAAETGVHTFTTYSDGGVKLWIDDRLVIEHWRQGWLPGEDSARVALKAGQRHRVRLEWTKDQGARRFHFLWKTPSADNATSLWSEAADGLDYYFIHGPSLDKVVAGYRHLTGAAPMMPRWTFGLWQSRQRYETAQQLTDAVAGFRKRAIPFDVIVQDWFYWPKERWGSHEFEAARFPDPAGWIKELHEKYDTRMMISVWGKYYPGTENFDAMKAAGFLYEPNLKENLKDWLGYPYTFYDPFSADARSLFWKQIDSALFRIGVDAWWLDASEPDLLPTPDLAGQRTHMQPSAGGNGIRMLNAYSLAQSQAVYEGQRERAPDQRVFILTRSAFAGLQRYAAATWSGDVTSTWTAYRRQIAAGLGFSLSGLPYWTMDVGGFSVPARFSSKTHVAPEDAEEWRELNTRWFQFGAFTPILRVHGEFPNREMWEFGGETHPAYAAQLKFDQLRYRLLPYLYSIAGHITHDAATMMRPLVMDFPADAAVRRVNDQYLFGPAFLVSPVTAYQARERAVYLPAGARWYDFWTGIATDGGKTITAPAPYDQMPLHVRAGAIVPFGPEMQHTGEKPADPIRLTVYTGTNGSFTLYEDDGLTYAYEKGAFARIPIRWDEAARALTIGAREGSFAGMLVERTFEVVFVTPERPLGFSFEQAPDHTIRYGGEAVTVQAKTKSQ